MPVAEAEVGEAVFEAIETRVRSLEAASALATATATEVEWTCFVLLRFRLPETLLSDLSEVVGCFNVLHFLQCQVSGILFRLRPAHFKWIHISHFEHSIMGRPAKGLPQ